MLLFKLYVVLVWTYINVTTYLLPHFCTYISYSDNLRRTMKSTKRSVCLHVHLELFFLRKSFRCFANRGLANEGHDLDLRMMLLQHGCNFLHAVPVLRENHNSGGAALWKMRIQISKNIKMNVGKRDIQALISSKKKNNVIYIAPVPVWKWVPRSEKQYSVVAHESCNMLIGWNSCTKQHLGKTIAYNKTIIINNQYKL